MCALFIGVAQNNLVLLCWLSLACLVFDVLDGQLARFRHNQTHFGKLLDAGIDIALSICIVISLLVLEKNILLYIGLFLIILYVFRFVAVVKNCEKEIGGLRPSLIIGLLTTFYLQIPINIILSIFLVWNAISALLSVADYVTSGNKNSAGI